MFTAVCSHHLTKVCCSHFVTGALTDYLAVTHLLAGTAVLSSYNNGTPISFCLTIFPYATDRPAFSLLRAVSHLQELFWWSTACRILTGWGTHHACVPHLHGLVSVACQACAGGTAQYLGPQLCIRH